MKIPFSSLKKIDFQYSEIIENQFDSLKKEGAFDEKTTEVFNEKGNNLKELTFQHNELFFNPFFKQLNFFFEEFSMFLFNENFEVSPHLFSFITKKIVTKIGKGTLFKNAMLQGSPLSESSNQTDQKSSSSKKNNSEDIQLRTNQASASGSGGDDEDNRKNKSIIGGLVEEYAITIEQFIIALIDGMVPFLNTGDLKTLSNYNCQIRDRGVYIEIIVCSSIRVYYKKEGLYTYSLISEEEAQNIRTRGLIQLLMQNPPFFKNQDSVFINNNNSAPERDTQSISLQRKNPGVRVPKELGEDTDLPSNNHIHPLFYLIGTAVSSAIHVVRKKGNIFLFKKKEKKEE